MAEFDPFRIPGYDELEEDFQAAWDKLVRQALPVADIAVGNAEYSPETVEELFEKYRVADRKFIRARDIRDDCWEAYAGDYKY